MMIVVIIFAVRGLKYRYGKCHKKYAPLVIVLLSAVLIMAEPTRHVLSDYNIWSVFATCKRFGCHILEN